MVFLCFLGFPYGFLRFSKVFGGFVGCCLKPWFVVGGLLRWL